MEKAAERVAVGKATTEKAAANEKAAAGAKALVCGRNHKDFWKCEEATCAYLKPGGLIFGAKCETCKKFVEKVNDKEQEYKPTDACLGCWLLRLQACVLSSVLSVGLMQENWLSQLTWKKEAHTKLM